MEREGILSWEARTDKVSFEVLLKRCNRWTISYMEKERVPKDRGIVIIYMQGTHECIIEHIQTVLLND